MASEREGQGDDATPRAPGRPRRVVCERCGVEFGCVLEGECWCSAETFRLPLPRDGAGDDGPRDCLCPDCLRARAAALR